MTTLRKITPAFVLTFYHYLMALYGALKYRLPSREMTVIGITGTKGKTSTTEILNAILEEAGIKTAIASTLRFKTGTDSRPNLLKMTMPGRTFLQKFMRDAKRAGITHMVVEMTSEGTKQFRHKFISLDALIFTNLSPEHIESHGSYEKYVAAKGKIVTALTKSVKKNKLLVLNGDEESLAQFRDTKGVLVTQTYLKEAEPHTLTVDGLFFTYKNIRIQAHLSGEFNLYNILSAIKVAEHLDISLQTIKSALEKFGGIPGRVEKIFPTDKELAKLQDFTVVVDYAHTADSLKKVYSIYKDQRKICVLGSAGGGRDQWKRRDMGEVADKNCSHIILTDEDPYDEDPEKIVKMVAEGITHSPKEIEMDRRIAIRKALEKATPGSVVLITGKGTDPYIMRAGGKKEVWSDAEVAREELEKVLLKKKS